MERAITFQKEFTELVIGNLKERFPDRGLTLCFKALAPCSFPSGVELKSYGFTEIEALANFYGETKTHETGDMLYPLIDKVALIREYQYFRAQACHEWKGRSLLDTWVSIGRNITTRDKYPMLLRLAHISMLQCSRTAACERGFSTDQDKS